MFLYVPCGLITKSLSFCWASVGVCWWPCFREESYRNSYSPSCLRPLAGRELWWLQRGWGKPSWGEELGAALGWSSYYLLGLELPSLGHTGRATSLWGLSQSWMFIQKKRPRDKPVNSSLGHLFKLFLTLFTPCLQFHFHNSPSGVTLFQKLAF